MTYESERVTRKKRIDPLLKAAGWSVEPFQAGMDLSRFNKCALEEFPTANGPADYALCLDGKIVAVIEAKKVTLGPQNVLTQAERYATGIAGSPVVRLIPLLSSVRLRLSVVVAGRRCERLTQAVLGKVFAVKNKGNDYPLLNKTQSPAENFNVSIACSD